MEVIGRGNGGHYNRRTFSRVHYNDMWSSYDEGDIVKKAWSKHGNCSGSNAVQLFKKTSKDSLAELVHWSKRTFEGSKKKLEKLMNRIKELLQHNKQYENGEEVKSMKERFIIFSWRKRFSGSRGLGRIGFEKKIKTQNLSNSNSKILKLDF